MLNELILLFCSLNAFLFYGVVKEYKEEKLAQKEFEEEQCLWDL